LADSASHSSKEVIPENAGEAAPLLWDGEAADDDGSDLEALSSFIQEEAMLPPWFDFHTHPKKVDLVRKRLVAGSHFRVFRVFGRLQSLE
jgi:hypothetical protein